MTTPERSVEEIVEEWNEYNSDKGGSLYPNRNEKWLTQTIQTERQRCEEVVEAERERILRSLPKYPPNSDREELVLKQVREALTQPNNPK